jgi:2'-5' RNA ligase
MSQRLFFALQPSADAIQKITCVMQQIDRPGLKFYSAENLHQTLVFLGQTQADQIAALIQQVDVLTMQRFTMRFTEVAYWPKPKVLCLTSSDIPAQLARLVSSLETVASNLYFQIEKRPYRPHITLARKATQAVDLEVTPIEFEASHFVLMASTPSDNGVQYLPLYRWKLA